MPGGHDAWRTDTKAVLDDAETLGLHYVGVASPPAGTPQRTTATRRSATEFNTFGAAAVRAGYKFYFHNHPTDFALDGGTPIYDTLLAETDPRARLVRARHRVDRGRRPERVRVREATASASRCSTSRTSTAPPTARGSTPANVAQPNRPYWIMDVGKGDIDFAKIFGALRRPGNHHYFVEHDDAPNDETIDATSPRPRNPAGSANTSWTSRKYLAELQLGKRRRRKH